MRHIDPPSGPWEFGGMVGSSFVTLSGEEKLSGSKIDLLHPRWQRVPVLDRGRWDEVGGLADREIVVGQRLLAAWWRGKLPIRVAVYDPKRNTWTRPAGATPPNAWFASNVALRDWWLSGTRDERGGLRFHVSRLAWAPMKPAPVASFTLRWPSAVLDNKAYFFNPEGAGGGVLYDADADAWTPILPGGPKYPREAHPSARTGRIAVFGTDDVAHPGMIGAVYDPAAKTWTPIAGDDGPRYAGGAPRAGPYLVSFFNPGDPIWLLDIDAARWRLVPQPPGARPRSPPPIEVGPPGGPIEPRPPRPPPQPKLLWAGDETLFLENVDCLGDACLSTGHVGAAGRFQLYDPEADLWCSLDFPAAVGQALGGLQYFRYEQVWRNRLLLWEAQSSQDFNTGGIPWSAANTRSQSKLSGGVVAW